LILEEPAAGSDMTKVAECGRAAGIQVVDQFAPLQALTRGDRDLVALHYSVEDGEFGHMTSKGNEHAAQLLAGALKDQAHTPPRSSALPDQNVLPN
jgi:hypothetical protein